MPTQYEISLNPISAKGDILSSDGSSRSRIPVGTNGHFLTASSTSTSGIVWQSPSTVNIGDMVLISSTSTTSASGTIDITRPALNAYQHFLITISSSSAGFSTLHIQNPSFTAANSYTAYIRSSSTSAGTAWHANDGQSVFEIISGAGGFAERGGGPFGMELWLFNVGVQSPSSAPHAVHARANLGNGTMFMFGNIGGSQAGSYTGAWSTIRISSEGSGDFASGTIINIYGVSKISRS